MAKLYSGPTVAPSPAEQNLDTFAFNLEVYEKKLNEFEWTSKQRREFLESLWVVLSCVIDFGYGAHPCQRTELPEELNHSVLKAMETRCQYAD